jgi:membrane-associated protease RseP (regulator of RpoE activity)
MWTRPSSLASVAFLALPISTLATPPAPRGYVGCRLEKKNGEILALVAGAPAERAGLRVGDVITAIDGTPVQSADAISSRLVSSTPESVLRLTVARDGKTREISLRVAQPPAQPPRWPIEDLHLKFVTSRDYRSEPGDEVDFPVIYEVPGDKPLQVTERREIVKDNRVLASWEDTFSRHPLNSLSEKPIRLPPDAARGKYTARVILRANGQEFRKDAEFEVQ